jgi:hypothetical protein
MKEHVVRYIAGEGIISAERSPAPGTGLTGNETLTCIFISPKDREIISSSITAEKALEMIIPSQLCGFEGDDAISELLNIHIQIELERCFERIEFREISGPAPEDWVRMDVWPDVQYSLRCSPGRFDPYVFFQKAAESDILYT